VTQAQWWQSDLRMLRSLPSTRSHAPFSVRTSAAAIASNPSAFGVTLLPDALSFEECQRVLAAARGQQCERGSMVGRNDGTRECYSVYLDELVDTQWLYDRIAQLFTTANSDFGFRLNGIMEPLMAACYAENDHFDWHLDAGPELAATRKLSLSLLLTRPETYDGGDLEISAAMLPYRQVPAGTAIIFPSFLSHRVTPVSRGRRISLVAFAHGPTFR
jgi:PKHD-type hydroxylase